MNLKKAVGEAHTRKTCGKFSTSLLIVDARSDKNTYSAREKDNDAGEKASVIKHCISVDTPQRPVSHHCRHDG